MDAELILLPLFREVRSHFRVSTREAIPLWEADEQREVMAPLPGPLLELASNACQPASLGLILWTMLLHHVSLAQRRCCCMRGDAGIMEDWPTG